MKPLEERLAEYLKKNPKKLMGRGVAPQALQRTAERFANMAELAANNAIPTTGSITAEASAVKIDGTTAMFTVDYDHDTAMRDSFYQTLKIRIIRAVRLICCICSTMDGSMTMQTRRMESGVVCVFAPFPLVQDRILCKR